MVGVFSFLRFGFLELRPLFRRPCLEFRNGIAQHGQFDVGVDRVNLLARAVTHQGFPYFLHDAGFEETGIEGVTQVVETNGTQTGAAEGRFPGGLDPQNRFLVEREDQSLRLAPETEVVEDAVSERDRTTLAARGFRVGDEDEPTREIDMLPALRQEFSPPHPGIEPRLDDGAKMQRSSAKELVLFLDTHDQPGLAAFLGEKHSAQRIRRQQALLHRPIKDVAQGFEIPVHGRIGEAFLLRMTLLPVVLRLHLVNAANGRVCKVGQQHLQSVVVVGSWRSVHKKSGHELPKGHFWFGLDDSQALKVQFLPEALGDGLSHTAVSRSGRARMPHAVDPVVRPIDFAPFEERQGIHLPSCSCLLRTQRMT